MERERQGPFVRLATLPDPAAADLCAALLRSAGIEPRLRGESQGPLRLSVGDLAATEVWVPAAEFDDARAIVDEAGRPGVPVEDREEAEAPDGGPVEGGPRRWWPLVALGLLALLAWRLLGRLL